ncbi:MAG: hypothetical protein HKN47_07765 [Pirellulaceae bacterium]|nr:hypothetical protein [Pirellulaceae bacterium]
MFEILLPLFDEIRRSFRFVDAVDVLLVSAFLYAALSWFRRTASRGVLIGVGLLAMVYMAARGLDMYLTSLAFHTSFAVLLFILVVVFQEDLRRLLERMSSLRSVRFARSADNKLDIDVIVESVFEMAASYTGALIVIRGKEPLDRHINGGVQLDGRISRPLLYSIFDSHTPGHDGAVIIQDNQVTQFSAHLPISQDTGEIAGRGTRHSAALGLSERSDALTVVVSEERGIVSVAQSAHLDEMPSAGELRQRLDEFLTKTFPVIDQPLWKRVTVQDGQLKLLSLVLALIAWFALAYDPHTIQRTFIVPIEYRNISKQLELDRSAPSDIRLTLSGSERHFRFLDPASLKITLDLSETGSGYQELPLSERNIRLPLNLVPYRIEPRVIRARLSPRVTPPVLPSDGNVTDGNDDD